MFYFLILEKKGKSKSKQILLPLQFYFFLLMFS